MIEASSGEHSAKLLAALEEFAVEASIAKVAGSETLNYVLDENVQIHGGNGYVKDYPAERHFRDARVNRIFEGTNEINRLLIPGMLMRKALKGDLPLIPAARRLLDEIMTPGLAEPPGDGLLDAETLAIAAFKKVSLLVLGAAMQRYGQKVTDEQEVLSAVADICIDTFLAESAVLRALDADARGLSNRAHPRDGGAGIRRRRGDAHRDVGANGAGGDGGRRHAAHPAGGAAARAQDDAGQYRGAAADAGGCDGGKGRVSVLRWY